MKQEIRFTVEPNVKFDQAKIFTTLENVGIDLFYFRQLAYIIWLTCKDSPEYK